VALKSRLALNASVKRDKAWNTAPAAQSVVGAVMKLSLGAAPERRIGAAFLRH